MIAWQLHGGGLTASHLFQGQLLRTLLPVFAEELEYMECAFFFPTSHRFPWVESGVPLDSQKHQAGGKKQSGTVQRVVPLVNCEVDMVVLSSYYSLAT